MECHRCSSTNRPLRSTVERSSDRLFACLIRMLRSSRDNTSRLIALPRTSISSKCFIVSPCYSSRRLSSKSGFVSSCHRKPTTAFSGLLEASWWQMPSYTLRPYLFLTLHVCRGRRCGNSGYPENVLTRELLTCALLLLTFASICAF